jgi:hypothetical protein
MPEGQAENTMEDKERIIRVNKIDALEDDSNEELNKFMRDMRCNSTTSLYKSIYLYYLYYINISLILCLAVSYLFYQSNSMQDTVFDF